jgi:hypothetical protein
MSGIYTEAYLGYGHVIFPVEFTTATEGDETDSVLSVEEDAEGKIFETRNVHS